MGMERDDWFGYAGTVLQVDLNDGHIEKTPLESTLAERYLGGKGFGAKILYDLLPEGCSPLSPENVLVFATGPLTGSLAPATGRLVLCTKSPETGFWLDSNCGGFFGPELKMAGYDVIVLKGRSPEPVMLVIDDEEVNLESASDLRGMDTISVHRWIKEHRGRDFRVATIGTAGEKGVLFANIISEYRAFGRGGSGAVMGSKNLKAIAVRGSRGIRVMDAPRFMKTCREAFNELSVDAESGGGRQAYGTNMILSCMNEAGIHPVRNFQRGVFEGAERVNEEAIREYYVRNKACFGCPMYCSKIAEVKDGKYRGSFVEGPEYENVWAFGAQCENTDIAAIIQAEYLCDFYGLDGISTGNVIGFLMECVEKGLLGDREVGFPLRFGGAEGIVQAIHLIGTREGPGHLWGEGVRRISERVEGSEAFSMHVKGLELPAYDPRGSTGMALAYATSDRGGCHLRSWTIGSELLSTEDRMDPMSNEFKAEFVKTQQDLFTVINAIGMCLFATSALGMRQITEFLHATTGLDVYASSEEILKRGERINNLVRLFNLREGLTREQDTLPERLLTQPLKEGPCRGRVVQLEPLIEEYYLVRGWDEQGVPKREKLEELELQWR